MRSRHLLLTVLSSTAMLGLSALVATGDLAYAKGPKSRPGSSRGAGDGGGMMPAFVQAKAAPMAGKGPKAAPAVQSQPSGAAKFATGKARAKARGTAMTESYDDSVSNAWSKQTPKTVTAYARNDSNASAHAESYGSPVPTFRAKRVQVPPSISGDAYSVTAGEVTAKARRGRTKAAAEAGGYGSATMTTGDGTTYAEVGVQTKATATFGKKREATAEYMSQGNVGSVEISGKNVTATGGAPVVQKIGSRITAYVATADGLALASVSKTRALALALTGATSYDAITDGLFGTNRASVRGVSGAFAYADFNSAFGIAGAAVSARAIADNTSVKAEAASLVWASAIFTPVAQVPVKPASDHACGVEDRNGPRVAGRLGSCCRVGLKIDARCETRTMPMPVVARY